MDRTPACTRATLPQRDDGPSVLLCMCAQRGVRIHGDGVGHPREERQVVQRVAVEPALAAAQVAAAGSEPLVYALDLSLAEGGRAARLSREEAPLLLDVGGDERGHAQLVGDGPGDESVGGGDDGGLRAGVARDELDR